MIPLKHRHAGLLAALAILPLAACQTAQPSSPPDANAPHANLRPIVAPKGGTQADQERSLLARFIGAWSFEGWVAGPDGAHAAVKGLAAGTIEDENFAFVTMKTTEGQLGVRAAHNRGTLMFASEPGIGLTLTAWGDGSPAISRLSGNPESDGSAFHFTEAKTPAGVPRVTFTATFQSDDKWTAELRDLNGKSPLATYTFTRK